VAYVHAVVFSPLNIGFPTLILLKIGCSKIADKIPRLDVTNRLSFSQAFASLLVEKSLWNRKKGKKSYVPEARFCINSCLGARLSRAISSQEDKDHGENLFQSITQMHIFIGDCGYCIVR
jgi:hypothetical protein